MSSDVGWHIRDKLRHCRSMVNIALRPQKPEGSLGRTAQDGHLDSHTAPELCPFHLLSGCFTSTEARWPIRDGDRVGRGRQSEGSTAETVRKRPERPWTAARTMEVLSVPSPLPSDLCTAQLLFQLLCWTESLRQCPLHCCWRTTWTTRSKRCPTCSAQLHLPTHDLFWENLRVQLHLPPLRSLDLAWTPACRFTRENFVLNVLGCHETY